MDKIYVVFCFRVEDPISYHKTPEGAKKAVDDLKAEFRADNPNAEADYVEHYAWFTDEELQD